MKRLLFILFALPLALAAQEDSTKKVKVVSVNAWIGGNITRGGFEDRTIFQQATPSSSLAFADLAGYGNQGGSFPFDNTYTNSNRGLMVYLKLCDCKASEFRIGIENGKSTISSQFYSKETSTILFTTPLPGGGILVSDSVYRSDYRYEWSSDAIALNLGWIVRTKPGRIFSVYAGGGIFSGLGFNGKINNSFLERSRIQHTSGAPTYVGYSTASQTHTDVEENFKAPGYSYFGAYIPVGFNVRLGRRNAILSHLVYFGEYQGAIQFLKPAGFDMRIRTSSGMISGLKWYITAPQWGWKKGNYKDGVKKHKHHE